MQHNGYLESWRHNSRTTPRTSLQTGSPVSNSRRHFNTLLYVPLIHLIAEVFLVIRCFRIDGVDDFELDVLELCVSGCFCWFFDACYLDPLS